MTISEDKAVPLFRAGDAIMADIWEALWNKDSKRSLDLGSLSINVEKDKVDLVGYLKEEDQPLIESKICSV